MRGVQYLFVLFICVGCALALVTKDYADALTAAHNKIRSDVSKGQIASLPQANPALKTLVWNLDLATAAQTRANTCPKSYSLLHHAGLNGELVLWGDINITTVIAHLAQQQNDFDYWGKDCKGERCNHFQQVVHSGTISFGCGSKTCPGIGNLLVCRYNKFGQFQGTLPYVTSVPQPDEDEEYDSDSFASSDAFSYESDSDFSWSDDNSYSGEKRSVQDTQAYKAGTNINYKGTAMVTSVKNQGSCSNCGVCWSFATAAVFEGSYGKAHKKRSPNLSVQQVVECSGGGGLNGGWPSTAMSGIVKRGGGVAAWTAYPYKAGHKGGCQSKKASVAIGSFGEFTSSKSNLVNNLYTHGPIAVSVYADAKLKSYRKGILKKNYSSVNHAVTLVGFNAKKNYYVIKNSWGASWGSKGYMSISAAKPYGMQKYSSSFTVAK